MCVRPMCCVFCARCYCFCWFLSVYSLAARSCPLLLTLNELNCVHSPHDVHSPHLDVYFIYSSSAQAGPPLSINLRKHSFSFCSRLYIFCFVSFYSIWIRYSRPVCMYGRKRNQNKLKASFTQLLTHTAHSTTQHATPHIHSHELARAHNR